MKKIFAMIIAITAIQGTRKIITPVKSQLEHGGKVTNRQNVDNFAFARPVNLNLRDRMDSLQRVQNNPVYKWMGSYYDYYEKPTRAIIPDKAWIDNKPN